MPSASRFRGSVNVSHVWRDLSGNVLTAPYMCMCELARVKYNEKSSLSVELAIFQMLMKHIWLVAMYSAVQNAITFSSFQAVPWDNADLHRLFF